MKLSIIIVILACVHKSTSFTLHHHFTRCTALHADPSRVKKAGAGIATIPSGNNSSFDPDANGKLQGTGNCNERVEKGALYGASPSTGGEGNGNPSRPPTSNLTSLINSGGSRSQY